MDIFRYTNRLLLFPDIDMEKARKEARKMLMPYRNRFKTEKEFEEAVEELANDMVFPYRFKQGRYFSVRPDNLFEVLFSWAKEGIQEGRFAVFKNILEVGNGLYTYDETSKVLLKPISKEAIMPENPTTFDLSGKEERNLLNNAFGISFFSRELLNQTLKGANISIIFDLSREEMFPIYLSFIESLLYPHRIKGNLFAVYKEFFWRLKDGRLVLVPFLQGAVEIDFF